MGLSPEGGLVTRACCSALYANRRSPRVFASAVSSASSCSCSSRCFVAWFHA